MPGRRGHWRGLQRQAHHDDGARHRGRTASDKALSDTLAQLRPWSLMVVVANADQYIEDVLTALTA